MGARNVSAAFAMWAHLPHGAFRLLVGMALQSMDAPTKEGRPARVWYGGEEALVEFMGGRRSTAYRALAQLREAKAVTALDSGRVGHRAVYKLALDATSVEAKGPTSGTQKGPRNGTQKGAENGTQRVPDLGPLGGTKEATKESREGDKSPPAVISPALVGPVDNPEFDEMTTEQANRELIKRHGLEHGVNLLAQHAAVHPECDNPAGHLLATTPSLRVIAGGRTA